MSCVAFEVLLKAYFEEELPAKERNKMEDHAMNCKDCSSEMKIFSDVNKLVDESVLSVKSRLVIPIDFTQSVMAKVHLKEQELSVPQRAGLFKRSFGFVFAFVVYAIYAINTVLQNDNEGLVNVQRTIGFTCLAFAAMGLAFLFFTKELMSLDNNLWARFSRKYEVFTRVDYQIGRMVGYSMLAVVVFYHLNN